MEDKIKAIYEALTATKIPVVYNAWPEGTSPDMPYICFWESGSDNFAADNHVFYSAAMFDVELYTKNKDTTNAALVESALGDVVWSRSVEYLNDERCYVTTYSFEM